MVIMFQMKNCGRRDTVTAAENIGCLDLWLLFVFTLELVHVLTSLASFHSCSALNALMLTALGSSTSWMSLSSELSSSLINVTVRNYNIQPQRHDVSVTRFTNQQPIGKVLNMADMFNDLTELTIFHN